MCLGRKIKEPMENGSLKLHYTVITHTHRLLVAPVRYLLVFDFNYEIIVSSFIITLATVFEKNISWNSFQYISPVYDNIYPHTLFSFCQVNNWLYMGFKFVIGVTEHLQIVTTSNCSEIANPNALQFITARTKTSNSSVSSPVVAWSLCSRVYLLPGWRLSHTSYSSNGLLEVKVTL
jgi:hypothetical protein